jgi:hypothetical protein
MRFQFLIFQKSFAISDISDLDFFLLKFKEKSNFTMGWLCTRWGEIAQSLNFKYLYKSHRESCELLCAFQRYHIKQNPRQFIKFAVTIVKIFKV